MNLTDSSSSFQSLSRVINVGKFKLDSSFDSGNFSHAEIRQAKLSPRHYTSSVHKESQMENVQNLSLWIKSECEGTPFQRSYKTWFHFAISGWEPGETVHFFLENMNSQTRLMRVGYTPVVKIGNSGTWQKISKRNVSHKTVKRIFKLDFRFTFPSDEHCSTETPAYFAMTYPFSFSDHLDQLSSLNVRHCSTFLPKNDEELYYHRQTIAESLEGRPIDLLTMSSTRGISDLNECQPLFLTEIGLKINNELTESSAPKLFPGKPVIFLTARVHPGETGASYVMKGVIDSLMNSKSAEIAELKRRFVFKLIPILNPDGVACGNYRCDTKGVNLNRVFNNPDPTEHPSIWATKQLIQWYHNRKHLVGIGSVQNSPKLSPSTPGSPALERATSWQKLPKTPPLVARRNSETSLVKKGHRKVARKSASFGPASPKSKRTPKVGRLPSLRVPRVSPASVVQVRRKLLYSGNCPVVETSQSKTHGEPKTGLRKDGGVAFYVDFHGHVSKAGCFFYGNHFEKAWEQAEGLVFGKLMALRAYPYFSLRNSVFSEKNMRQKDKNRTDGNMVREEGKEGSGRVAIFESTRIMHCYTLECNYHGGIGENDQRFVFTPEIYAKIGESLLLSMLDYNSADSNQEPGWEFGSSDNQSIPGRVPLETHVRKSRPPASDIRTLRIWAKYSVEHERRRRNTKESQSPTQRAVLTTKKRIMGREKTVAKLGRPKKLPNISSHAAVGKSSELIKIAGKARVGSYPASKATSGIP